MKKHRYTHWIRCALLGLAGVGLTACVTINIYFPAAAAEKAADKVIDEIWQVPAGQTPASNQHVAPPAAPVVPAAPPVIPSANPEHTP